MSFTGFLWILLIVLFLLPMLQQQRIFTARIKAMRAIESKNSTRVISLIHRQEALSFLSVVVRRFIDIEDSEQILRAIRLTPADMPIDLILHTPGGLVLASEQIAHALQNHPAKVTVYVPHYAMSGGTLIALAADEIVMDENAVMGPVDPQIGTYPAASLLKVLSKKELRDIDDETIILADVAGKAVKQVEDFVFDLLVDTMLSEKAREIAKTLSEGRWTHDYPINAATLQALGLPVRKGLPTEIYELMELYPQPGQRRPSVQYIPIPYVKRSEIKDK